MSKSANHEANILLQQRIADHCGEHGVESAIRVCCNMLAAMAEHTGSFEVEVPDSGVVINVEVLDD